jgi:hypothetical protein
MSFARKHASEEQINNNSAKTWKIFKETLYNESLDSEERDGKLNCMLEKLVELTEPEMVIERRIGVFKTILREETMSWRNKMNFLRQAKKLNPDNNFLKLAFNEASRLFSKLSKLDMKSTLTESMGVEFMDENEFFKINNKLNKNNSKITECPMSADEIADGFNNLQWQNPIKIDNKNFDTEKCVKKCDQIPRFKLRKVNWAGKDRSTSLLAALKTCKNNSRGRSGLDKRFLGALTPSYKKVMLELVNNSLTKGKYHSFWKTSRVTPIPKKGKDPKYQILATAQCR